MTRTFLARGAKWAGRAAQGACGRMIGRMGVSAPNDRCDESRCDKAMPDKPPSERPRKPRRSRSVRPVCERSLDIEELAGVEEGAAEGGEAVCLNQFHRGCA